MRRRSFCCSLSVVALGAPAVARARAPFRVGLTPVILADQAAFLLRWRRYLGQRCGFEIDFVTRQTYQEIIDLLLRGGLDAAWLCGYAYVRYEAWLALLAVPLYGGTPHYQAYLIRPRQTPAPVTGWPDLAGRVLAYSDPLSNSGWLVAQVQLGLVGLSNSALRRSFFAYGHRNVAHAVAARLADAGCIDGYVWDTMQRHAIGPVQDTEVIWRSQPFGFPPLVVRRDDAERPLPGALRAALQAMHTDAQGQELLAILNLSGFTAARDEWFDGIRQQAAWLSTRATHR